MVNGLNTFKEAFKGYEDCYTIIGGTACDILMSEQNYSFRATKDIDMIIIIDVRFEEFASVLWHFINSGGYKSGWRGSDSPHYYRFTEPKSPEYPKMIELFSRNPGYDLDIEDSITTPIHVSDDISSLSAIMLNDDYYNIMIEGRRVVELFKHKTIFWLVCLLPAFLLTQRVRSSTISTSKYFLLCCLYLVN